MAYSELIKNFSRIRDYMREFFAFGFRTRTEYSSKSARSYDNERRRIESWLGGYMAFRRTESGKNVFLSVDSRDVPQNPLYKAFQAKSFTDKDITLYFLILDLLADRAGDDVSCLPGRGPAEHGLPSNEEKEADLSGLSAAELHDAISETFLAPLDSELDFDLSTLRKKLKEFEELGLVRSRKSGNRLLYSLVSSRTLDSLLKTAFGDAIAFFSEEAPLGVIGSYLAAREQDAKGQAVPEENGAPERNAWKPGILHKHHYILSALDSEVMLDLLTVIREKRRAEITMVTRRGREITREILPLQVFVSTRSGRQHLLACSTGPDGAIRPEGLRYDSIRLDQIQKVVPGEPEPLYDDARARFRERRRYMWGVSLGREHGEDNRRLVHVEMDVRAGAGEAFIPERMKREARCGRVLQVDPEHWRFAADLSDSLEILPWVRTFTGRITRLATSDGFLEERFYQDLGAMRRMYDE